MKKWKNIDATETSFLRQLERKYQMTEVFKLVSVLRLPDRLEFWKILGFDQHIQSHPGSISKTVDAIFINKWLIVNRILGLLCLSCQNWMSLRFTFSA